MRPSFFLVIATLCGTGATTRANDYVLRLETVGYIDVPVTEKEPEETLLRSIEVVARAGAPFYTRVTVGKETLVLRGELRLRDDGRFGVQLHYSSAVDRFDKIQPKSGDGEAAVDRAFVATTIEAKLGTPIAVSCLKSSTNTREPPSHTRSKQKHVLVLQEYR